jgi:tRNA nucleotidyltransferase (CCA-adding enzyme)
MLMVAALSHDLGKPDTTLQVDGRWRTPGHGELGRGIAERFLKAIACPDRIIERVLPLVEEHLVHVRTDHTARSVRRLALRLHPATLRELALLVEADHSGRPPLPGGLPEAMRTMMELGQQAAVAEMKPKPLLLGRHLMPLGIAPGPAMGAILKVAFEAQLDGQYATVDDGVAWARGYIGTQTKVPPTEM